jgi:primosomal protein N' (replication factor Y)
MVYHKPGNRAMCHYCGTRTTIPRNCPDVTCSGRLARFGMGTQRIEEELKAKFPDARVERADSDTMQRASDYSGLVTRFENRQFDVLVGTQMIAKGLDFPFVSFVGVISADTALAIPDFRAGERTFQLVTQVAGRAGRSALVAGETPGQVVVQSLSPDLPAIKAAVRQDYELFAEDELAVRSQLGLPPFARLVRLVLSDPRETKLESESAALAERIRTHLADPALQVRVAGPARCTLARIRDMYRRQILISMSDISRRAEITAILRREKLLSARVKRLTVDPDPVSLL